MRYSRNSAWSAASVLLGVNILAFMLQLFLGEGFTRSFFLASDEVLLRPWIVVTSMFLHASPGHLFFNMYALLIFGPLLEQRMGRNRFLGIYFASGIIASVGYALFQEGILGVSGAALGASGAVMGLIGVTIMLMPNLQVLFFFIIPMSLRTAGIIIAAIDIFGVFNPTSKIANIAHLAGLACGLLYGYYLLKQKKQYTRHFVVHHNTEKSRQGIHMNKEDIDEYLKKGRL